MAGGSRQKERKGLHNERVAFLRFRQCHKIVCHHILILKIGAKGGKQGFCLNWLHQPIAEGCEQVKMLWRGIIHDNMRGDSG